MKSLPNLLTRPLIAILAMILTACAGSTPTPSSYSHNAATPEQLMAVDCLLPGQVRKLGSQTTFLTPRQVVKTVRLDCEIRGGEYIAYDRADYRTALNAWLEQAKAGDAEAMVYVGEIFERGLGLQPDYQSARHWYSQAAAKGSSRAAINLGHLYEKGLGVAPDKVAALNWYRKASGAGDSIGWESSIDQRAAERADEMTTQYRQRISAQAAQIDSLNAQLQSAQQLLADKTREADSAEQQIRNLQQQIRQGQQRGQDTSGLEIQLQQQQQRVRAAEQQIERLSAQISRQQSSLPKPIIEIIAPQILATRGSRDDLTLRSSGIEPMLRGKITAAAGLRSAAMNGQRLNPDPKGFFQTPLPRIQQKTRMTIVATDTRGQSGRLAFTVLPPGNESPDTRYEAINRAANDVDFGKYYALVIGNANYRDFPQLQTPVNDARKVAEILKKQYGFSTRVVLDADRYTMLSAINDIKNQLNSEDNLLIYYAGHGEIDTRTSQGYWLPVDAEASSTANWIPNTAISDLINTIPAKHILVIADSCYSGSMTPTAIPRLRSRLSDEHIEKWLRVMSKTTSRTVLTSGGVEPVLDQVDGEHSVFARALIDELSANRGVIDAYRVYLNVYNQVRSSAATVGFNQEPSYAPIQHTGHGGGEFILVGG